MAATVQYKVSANDEDAGVFDSGDEGGCGAGNTLYCGKGVGGPHTSGPGHGLGGAYLTYLQVHL